MTVFDLCETRLRHGDPPAIKNGIAPVGFSVLHESREPTAPHPAGGVLAVIYNSAISIRPQRLPPPTSFKTFQYQLVRVTSA